MAAGRCCSQSRQAPRQLVLPGTTGRETAGRPSRPMKARFPEPRVPQPVRAAARFRKKGRPLRIPQAPKPTESLPVSLVYITFFRPIWRQAGNLFCYNACVTLPRLRPDSMTPAQEDFPGARIHPRMRDFGLSGLCRCASPKRCSKRCTIRGSEWRSKRRSKWRAQRV
jgi:hypothetical protein